MLVSFLTYDRLHLDFHIAQRDPERIKDYWISDLFHDVLDPDPDVEVLIMCGDSGHYVAQDMKILEIIARVFSYKKIFMVLGNHNLYHSSNHSTQDRLDAYYSYEDPLGIIHILNGDIVEYKGVKFGGCMMYSDVKPYLENTFGAEQTPGSIERLFKRSMNDAYYIDGLSHPRTLYDTEIVKLRRIYQDVDVMITHYSPSIDYYHFLPEYRGDITNAFYCFDGEAELANTTAEYWFFGHSHGRFSYESHGVQCILNSFGYPGESGAAKRLTIELERPCLVP